MSRRYEGMDFGKVTVRLDEETDSVIQQYVDDHPGAKKSDAIRCALEIMGTIQKHADDIETDICWLTDIYTEQRKIPGNNEHRSRVAAMWCAAHTLYDFWHRVNE